VNTELDLGISQVLLLLRGGSRIEIDAVESRLHAAMPGCLLVVGLTSFEDQQLMRIHLHPTDVSALEAAIAADPLVDRIEAAIVENDDEEHAADDDNDLPS
jgi:hypothetical protein